MRLTGSLHSRLLLGAAAWGLLALVLTELLLLYVARDQLESQVRARLSDDLQQLLAVSEADADGRPAIQRELSDPLYQRVFSGHYWQVSHDGETVARSRSLWDQSLSDAAAGSDFVYLEGPRGQSLLALTRQVTLPRLDGAVTLTTATDLRAVDTAMDRFTLVFSVGFAALALGLLLAAFLQVRLGLRPLRRLRDELASIRRAESDTLAQDYPSEVAPLVADLNAVLRDNHGLIERARSRAGNLAHALKTPLSVLANEADARDRAGDPALASRLRQGLDEMQRQIDWHLAHARIAAARRPGMRTPVAQVTERLQRTLGRLFRDRTIEVRMDGEPAFAGESQDLEQMLGNLMDNACKWSVSRARVSAGREQGWLQIAVEDDGPGLAPEIRARALDRGRRLDETVPGSGLGLSIVQELAALYGGELRLETSTGGGLCARLTLPAAD